MCISQIMTEIHYMDGIITDVYVKIVHKNSSVNNSR